MEFETKDWTINKFKTKTTEYKKISLLFIIKNENITLTHRIYIANSSIFATVHKCVLLIEDENAFNNAFPLNQSYMVDELQLFNQMEYNINNNKLSMHCRGKIFAYPDFINDNINTKYTKFSIKLSDDDKKRFCQCLREICFKCNNIFNNHKPSSRRNSIP